MTLDEVMDDQAKLDKLNIRLKNYIAKNLKKKRKINY